MIKNIIKKVQIKHVIQKINNIQIKSKLLGLISLFAIFIIVLGSISITYIFKINKSAEQMYENNMLANLYLSQISEKNLQLQKLEIEYVLSDYSMDRTSIRNEMASVRATIPEAYHKLVSLQLTEYTKQLLVEYDELYNVTVSEFNLVKERVEDNRQLEAYMYYQNRLSKEREALLETLSEMTKHNLVVSDEVNKKNISASQKAVNWMIIMMLGLIMLVTIIFIHIYRHIKHPISNLSSEMEKVKLGNLDVSLAYLYDNELGTLSKNFLAMTTEINTMVKSMKKNAAQVTENSSELLESTTQMQQFASNMSMQIKEVANQSETQVQHMNESVRAMEEVAKGIARINESTIEVSEHSVHAYKYSLDGVQSMQNIHKQMQSILQGSSETYSAIEAFSQTSNEISKFVSIIEEISSQVQLLALNASIEAARAGEHGRGFAVVATEVRQLADHTKDASQSIGKMVKAIQNQANSAVNIVEKEQHEVSQGIKEVTASEVIFNRITEAVETINAQLQEVSASTEQMSASTQEVTSSLQEVSHLSEVSSQNSLQVAELAKHQQYIMGDIKNNADDLDQVAKNLNNEADKFITKK